MAVSITDRDSNYMRQMWGTNALVTDYNSERVLKEVMYDPAKQNNSSKEELFENFDENEFEYGVEPTYKLKKGQKVL